MSKIHLHDAVPPVPERYLRNMARTLNGLSPAKAPAAPRKLR